MVFVFVAFFIFFKAVDAIMGNRVSAATELEGLDIPEMGALAYPDFVLGPGTPLHGDVAMSSSSAPAGAASLKPARTT
jgi:Amt family ammonium transporter